MPFINGNFPRIKASFVFSLRLPILQNQNSLNIPISGRVVQQSIEAAIHLIQLTPVFDQLDEAVVVVVADCDHGRGLLELIQRSVRQNLLFEDELHDLGLACACQQVEQVCLVFGQRPEIHVWVVDE